MRGLYSQQARLHDDQSDPLHSAWRGSRIAKGLKAEQLPYGAVGLFGVLRRMGQTLSGSE
jgi:hypothetical protein